MRGSEPRLFPSAGPAQGGESCLFLLGGARFAGGGGGAFSAGYVTWSWTLDRGIKGAGGSRLRGGLGLGPDAAVASVHRMEFKARVCTSWEQRGWREKGLLLLMPSNQEQVPLLAALCCKALRPSDVNRTKLRPREAE